MTFDALVPMRVRSLSVVSLHPRSFSLRASVRFYKTDREVEKLRQELQASPSAAAVTPTDFAAIVACRKLHPGIETALSLPRQLSQPHATDREMLCQEQRHLEIL